MRWQTRFLRLCFFNCGVFYTHRGHWWRILDDRVKLIRFDSRCSGFCCFISCNDLWADHPRRVLPALELLDVFRVMWKHLTCFVDSLEGALALISLVRVQAKDLCHLIFIHLLFCFNMRLHNFFLTGAFFLPQGLVSTVDYSWELLWGYTVQSTVRIHSVVTTKRVLKTD